jgi:hypothetical protein
MRLQVQGMNGCRLIVAGLWNERLEAQGMSSCRLLELAVAGYWNWWLQLSECGVASYCNVRGKYSWRLLSICVYEKI